MCTVWSVRFFRPVGNLFRQGRHFSTGREGVTQRANDGPEAFKGRVGHVGDAPGKRGPHAELVVVQVPGFDHAADFLADLGNLEPETRLLGELGLAVGVQRLDLVGALHHRGEVDAVKLGDRTASVPCRVAASAIKAGVPGQSGFDQGGDVVADRARVDAALLGEAGHAGRADRLRRFVWDAVDQDMRGRLHRVGQPEDCGGLSHQDV